MQLVASDNHRAPRMLCPLGKTALAAFRRVAAVFLLLVAVPAMTTSTRGDSYPKIEASFSITNLATDPFDYIVTDVRVQVLQPDSSTLSLPAFFDGGTPWRVRHTPIPRPFPCRRFLTGERPGVCATRRCCRGSIK